MATPGSYAFTGETMRRQLSPTKPSPHSLQVTPTPPMVIGGDEQSKDPMGRHIAMNAAPQQMTTYLSHGGSHGVSGLSASAATTAPPSSTLSTQPHSVNDSADLHASIASLNAALDASGISLSRPSNPPKQYTTQSQVSHYTEQDRASPARLPASPRAHVDQPPLVTPPAEQLIFNASGEVRGGNREAFRSAAAIDTGDPYLGAKLATSPPHPSIANPFDPLSPEKESNQTTAAHERSGVSFRLPSPPGRKSEDEKALYYVEYLRHRRHEVRLGSLNSIRQIAPGVSKAGPELVARILKALELYENQEESFNLAALDVLRILGHDSRDAIVLLLHILRNPNHPNLYEPAVHCLLNLGNEGLECLVDVASEGGRADETILTIIANLPFVQTHVVVPNLVREINSGSAERKEGALCALGKLAGHAEPEVIVPVLVQLLKRSSDRLMLAKSIRGFGMVGEAALIDLIQHDANSRVRIGAATGLGFRYDPHPKRLYVVVENDSREKLGEPTQTAYLAKREELGLPCLPLDEELDEDDYENVRIQYGNILYFDSRDLVSSLRRFIHANADSPVYNPSDGEIPSLHSLYEQAMQTGDGQEGEGGEGGDSNPEDALSNNQSQAPFRAFFISEEGVACLIAAAVDKDEGLRHAAVLALGQVGLPYAFPAIGYLAMALEDRSVKVRAAAAQTLGNLGPDVAAKSIDVLTKLLRDEFWKVRFSACEAIGKLGSAASAALPTLMKILREGTVKRTVVSATIAQIGVDGEEELVRLVREETRATTQMRVSAAYGLGMMSPSSPLIDTVTDVLYQVCKDQMPLIRRGALEALATLARRSNETVTFLRSRTILPFFYSFLKDKDKGVRQMAAEALALSGPHGELLLIEGVLKDMQSMTRAGAAHGLTTVGPSTIRTLILALNDKDRYVREVVGQSIQSIGLTAIVEELSNRPKSHRDSVVLSARDILNSLHKYPPPLETLLSNIITKVNALPDGLNQRLE